MAAPTDQRARVRPISFLIEDGGQISSPVTLKVRPEDLTRNEPSRVTVHQTLGREVSGWSDNFGAGLPSVTIAGHTGWRAGGDYGMDGVQSFERLNSMVVQEYHQSKQAAINAGRDPAGVKLLFVDMLDNFAWNVAPMQFTLRRNKSRPLLMQYNIVLQAISTSVDQRAVDLPFFGSVPAGLVGLNGAIGTLNGFVGSIQGWVSRAVSGINGLVAPIAVTVRQFTQMSTSVFAAVQTAVSSVTNGVRSVANTGISIARDMATIGVNVFRTLAAIQGIPGDVKAALGRVAGAYNEVLCLFSNSLRPRKTYEDYEGLYGASNCSSTTGGRGSSVYLNENAFSLMQPQRSFIEMNTPAMSSTTVLSRTDPVLAPMSIAEMDRHLAIVISGMQVSQP